MPADHLIDIINSKPGIQRDGTQFDSQCYIDGQHTRFYKGRPKKMGGRVLLDPGTTEIIRNIYPVEKLDNSTDIYLGRPSTLSVTNIANNIAAPEINRTPANFVTNSNNTWSFDLYTQQNASSPVALGNNPLTSTHNSGVVTVTVASTVGLVNGQSVTIAGAANFDGLTALQLNITAPITIVDATHFSYVTTGSGTVGGVAGGGNAVTYNLDLPITYLIAVAAPNLLNMNNQVLGTVYWGDITLTSVLTPLGAATSGGVVVGYPFLIVYGNNGLIAWTEDPSAFDLANVAQIASTKIVKGVVTRAGTNAPGFLFWSLRSLVRATFVGGATTWAFDTIQQGVPILAQNSVVSTENAYYWISNDQFWMYDGVVRELENFQNRLFFFKNLNWDYRNKIFGEYRPEFHEIWWHFPFGNSTENNHAIIHHLESGLWFDTAITRSSGTTASNYGNPLLTDSSTILNVNNPLTTQNVALPNNPLSSTNGNSIITVKYNPDYVLQNGNTITIAGAQAFDTFGAPDLNIQTTIFNLDTVAQTFQYTANGGPGTGVANQGGANVNYTIAVPNLCYGLWEEDIGTDEIAHNQQYAIDSYIESHLYTWFEKFPNDDAQIRIRRIEPDFVQSGNMTLTIKYRAFAQSTIQTSSTYTFVPGQTTVEIAKVDTVNMGRLVSFRFESNTQNGDYLMGKVVINYAKGDVRP